MNNNIIIINNKNKYIFLEKCKNIFIKSLKEYVFCAIDFEYNTNKLKERYISLAQFKFDNNIYIIDLLNFEYKKEIIKYIFCSEIIKIFHGSDSLDFPHMYKFINDKNNFIKFVNYSVDTLFLCNIYQILTNKLKLTDNKKCNIYDALYSTDVILQDKYLYLQNICKKINYNKNWFINNLTENQILYSSYDVLYSIDLFRKLVILINDDIIISLINRIYRFHMLVKLDVLICDYNKKSNNNFNKKITIIYKNKKYDTEINNEDILNINVIKKTVLNLINTDIMFCDSFKLLKGYDLLSKIFI